MNIAQFPKKTSRAVAMAALAAGLTLSLGSGIAVAKPKCAADAGECKSQDDRRKSKEATDSYPGCLSTHGGPGCRGLAPDPKLPKLPPVTPQLPGTPHAPEGGTTHRR
ncbi:hypothetical protein [uncultured Methylibium sp.]|uniref:hypothetical protein n=1 Tax=uncultured Methylibium sp. TaxID=381093 RepID=UPI0025DCB226|nr:hypothetical protein [uncultured Methylibium sp.]